MNPLFHQNRLFRALSTEVLREVEIPEETYEAGTVIFSENSPGSSMMLLGAGVVQISKAGWQGKPEILSTIEPNDFFGELSMIDHGPRSATALALTTCVVGVIDRPTLDYLMELAPRSISVNFTQVTVERLRYTDSRFIDQLLRTERLTLLGTMVSSIVHDFKNPMSAIISSVDYLDRRATDNMTKSLAAVIRTSVDRMMLLTEELLDFARGTARLHLRTTSVSRILELVEEEILGQVRRTPAEVVVEQNWNGELWVDESRITRLISNLVKNAYEAIRSRGRIRLSFAEDQDQLLISVEDNGKGIPEELRPRIFEPFVTYDKRGGTGLGLAIAKSCVEAHGGRIWFESAIPEGTVFFALVPKRAHNAGCSAGGPAN